MGARGSKLSGTPLAKRLQKGVYNAATTLKRGSNSFFAKVRGIFTRKAAPPPNTATRRAKSQKYINMLERVNKSPKGLNWLRKGYYGVKKLFNKKSMKNRIAIARAKPLGGYGAYTVVGSARSGSGSSRSGSGRSTPQFGNTL